jgi:hypothetical protein
MREAEGIQALTGDIDIRPAALVDACRWPGERPPVMLRDMNTNAYPINQPDNSAQLAALFDDAQPIKWLDIGPPLVAAESIHRVAVDYGAHNDAFATARSSANQN